MKDPLIDKILSEKVATTAFAAIMVILPAFLCYSLYVHKPWVEKTAVPASTDITVRFGASPVAVFRDGRPQKVLVTGSFEVEGSCLSPLYCMEMAQEIAEDAIGAVAAGTDLAYARKHSEEFLDLVELEVRDALLRWRPELEPAKSIEAVFLVSDKGFPGESGKELQAARERFRRAGLDTEEETGED